MSSRMSISHGWNVLRFMVPRTNSASSLLKRVRTASGSCVSTDIPIGVIGGTGPNLKPIQKQSTAGTSAYWMRHLRGDSGFRNAGYCDPLRIYVRRVQLLVIEDERSGALAEAQPDGTVLTARIRRRVDDISCERHALAVEVERAQLHHHLIRLLVAHRGGVL